MRNKRNLKIKQEFATAISILLAFKGDFVPAKNHQNDISQREVKFHLMIHDDFRAVHTSLRSNMLHFCKDMSTQNMKISSDVLLENQMTEPINILLFSHRCCTHELET